MNAESHVILHVEDDQDHAALVRDFLRQSEIAVRIEHVFDGEAALDYMLQRGQFQDAAANPRPHLVLLDLRLPRVDGLEILRTIKSTDQLAATPVVVLSSSDSEKDVAAAYTLHANSYLVKTSDFQDMLAMIRQCVEYWLGWNRQPVHRAGEDSRLGVPGNLSDGN